MHRGQFRRRSAAACAALVASALVISPLASTASATSRHGGNLGHHLQVIPAGATKTGELNDTVRLSIRVALLPRDPAALMRFIAATENPRSPQFHHYLARGAYARAFGPTAATINAVSAQLGAHGLVVTGGQHDASVLSASGTVGSIERLFKVTIGTYRLADGATGFSANRPPTLAGALAHDASGIVGLTTLWQRRPMDSHAATHALRSPSGPTACPDAKGATSNGAAPPNYTTDQLAHLYGLTTPYRHGSFGAGQTIGLYELAPYSSTDISVYEHCFGVATPVTNVNVDGPPHGSPDREPTLDIETVVSLVPEAHVIVYQGDQNTTNAANDIITRMATDDRASVLSFSWGGCEALQDVAPNPTDFTQSFEAPLFARMAAQGQTVVAASGDSGASDCYAPGVSSDTSLAVDDPASQPYVTGVGATTITTKPTFSQRAWNSGSIDSGASGGGMSAVWTHADAPWQVGPGISNPTARMVPDISVDGDPATGFVIYKGDEGGWETIGGTSAASPFFGAAVALANQDCGYNLGFMNPLLYKMAATNPADFADVTVGTNIVDPTVGGYSAGPGYDMASGLGSPTAQFFTDICHTVGATAATTVRGTGLSGVVSTSFVTTDTLPPGSTLTLAGPPGMTMPSNTNAVSVSVDGAVVGATAGSDAAPGSPTHNRLNLVVTPSIGAGSTVSISISHVINPLSGTYTSVRTVTTSSSDPTVHQVYRGDLSFASSTVHSWMQTSVAGSTGPSPASTSITLGSTALDVTTSVVSGRLIATAVTSGLSHVGSVDLSAMLRLPPIKAASIASLSTRALIVAITASGNVLSLTSAGSLGARWHLTTVGSGAQRAVGTPCLAVASTPRHATAVAIVRLSSGHLAAYVSGRLDTGPWSQRDLSTSLHVLAVRSPSCVGDGSGLDLVTTTRSGHMVDFALRAPSLTVAATTDLTASLALEYQPVGAPAIATSAGVFSLAATLINGHSVVVTHRGASWFSGWSAVDLTASAGGPSGLGGLAVSSSTGRVVIVGRSGDGRIEEFTNNLDSAGPDAFNAYDLTGAFALSPTTSDLSATAVGGRVVVTASTTVGHFVALAGVVPL